MVEMIRKGMYLWIGPRRAKTAHDQAKTTRWAKNRVL